MNKTWQYISIPHGITFHKLRAMLSAYIFGIRSDGKLTVIPIIGENYQLPARSVTSGRGKNQ